MHAVLDLLKPRINMVLLTFETFPPLKALVCSNALEYIVIEQNSKYCRFCSQYRTINYFH